MLTNREIRIAALLAVLLLATASPQSGAEAGAPASDAVERESHIFERQQVMDRLAEDSELLGKIVAGSEQPTKLKETTRSIASGAQESLGLFRKGIAGGRTKPSAWEPDSDFFRKMEAFARNTEAMAKAGETGSVTAVTALMIDALPCTQCHISYREPKQR